MSMIFYMFDFPDVHLDQLLANPETITSLIEEESEFMTSLGKAWHGLHFLLNDEPWSGKEPVNYLICSGEEVGDIDVGYGPARAVKSKQVEAFHEALEQLSDEDLKKRFDADKFHAAEIYPSLEHDLDGEVKYLLFYFDKLKKFLAEAKRNGVGMVVFLS